MEIILASASPRRKELLRYLFDSFQILPADVDETVPEGLAPEKVPEFLSKMKAEKIALLHPNSLVIAADTIVCSQDKILGKPKDAREAQQMLSLLSGRAHRVLTGCTLAFDGKEKGFTVESEVTFYTLSDEDMKAYISTGEPFGKAGAYAIQGKASLFVKEIRGDFFNIVGLPIARLQREIRQFLLPDSI